MPVALVTGAARHIGAAAATLGRTGFEVFTWAVGSPAAPAEGPFDCYVQLPCAAPDPAGGPASACRAPGGRSADDLVCRIDALAAVAGRLRPDASVLLAVDEPEPSAVKPGGMAPDLLAAVAGALLEDLGRHPARLAVVGVEDLYRRESPAPVGASGTGRQWEMPTPPLVSAP